jgi:hypothetical protein
MQRLGMGATEATNKGIELYGEKLENDALKKKGIDVSGIRDPETRAQIISHELQYGKRKTKAESTRGLLTGENESEPAKRREKLPEFMEGKSSLQKEGFEQRGKQENVNEPSKRATILPPDEVINKGVQYARMSSQAGNPMSDEEGISIVHAFNEEAKHSNAQQMALETHYGNVGSDVVSSYFPNPSPEIDNHFRKKAEEAGESGKSEADIKKDLNKEAIRLKNQISNIRKNIKPQRLGSKAYRKLKGTYKDKEKEEENIRKEIKPLLDAGFYDETRQLLSEEGLYPEETESLVTSLSEGTKKSLSQFPKMNKEVPGKMQPRKKAGLGLAGAVTQNAIERKMEKEAGYTPEQMETINDSVKNIFTSDPQANMILLRKAFEDKGVDWRAFKDSIDQGILEGYIDLKTEDQFNHYSDLSEPPLDDLDEMLYNAGIIGR